MGYLAVGLASAATAVSPAFAAGPAGGPPGPPAPSGPPAQPGPGGDNGKPDKPDKPDKADKPDKGARDQNTILVEFAQPGYNNDDLVEQDGDQANGSIGNLVTKTVIVKLKPNADVDQKIAEYQARDDVVFAEPNGIASTSDDPGSFSAQAGVTTTTTTTTTTDPSATQLGAPNDPQYPSQWGLGAIHAFDAWKLFANNYNVTQAPPIAILDSGVDSLHPDLYGKVATDLGANCLTGVCVSDGAADDYGHGTHVAGIAAADANDSVGIAGVSWSAPIIPVKVLDSSGNGTFASIASGIIWATDQGAKVLNLSLGSTAYSQTVCDAVAYAVAHGAVVVAAAGNNGTSTAFYPAGCPGAIGVGATDSTDTRASFSETSYPNVFLSAPGVGIVSDFPNSQYKVDTGTSMAAPFVSGVADLLLMQDPSRTPLDVKKMLAGTADKVGTLAYGSDPYATCACTWNAGYGYGRLNAYRAMTEAPPASTADFSLSGSTDTISAARGKSATMSVSSTTTTGFSGVIGFSITGLPSGVSASFSPTSVTGVGTSTLTVSASTSAAYGSYPVTIKGTSGALVRTLQATVVVPTPDYSLKLAPTSATVVQGDKPTTAISLNNIAGFAGTVSLAVSGAHTGVTTALSRTSISGTTASTLTMTTASTTTPGTYQLTITGTSGSLVRTATYTLTVNQAVPDFTISSATTSSSVRYGRSTTISYKLSLTPKYGFKGAVSLSVAGTPPGTTGSFNPQSVSISTTSSVASYYTLSVPGGTAVGKYIVTFTGLGYNGATHSVSATITIS